MRMTLRQLAVFVAVAQEGTVTKASDAVRLTQSAASMALADLEDGLGAPLFDRLGKRLQLNDLGRFYCLKLWKFWGVVKHLNKPPKVNYKVSIYVWVRHSPLVII